MKVALVTGGSRGIGAETVKKFARNGYTVILNYLKSDDKAVELRNSLLEEGCDVHLYKADVSDVAQTEEMFRFVRQFFKRLDVLVNNAGIAFQSMCEDTTEENFDRVMNINAKGAFFCCKFALPLLRTSHGSIVNVSSVWGRRGASCESVYSMSKFAVVGLTKSLAKELACSNVNVNCVCPPIVRTDMCSCYSDGDIENFCRSNRLKVYSAEQVAQDIFNLAVSEKTGEILQEK